jgi:hypothetical protein
MPNPYVFQRLQGIQSILMGVHSASAPLSAASKGAERQAFIEDFLGKVLPPIFRFGTGDATDQAGYLSGQLDVVVEYPFSPTLPAIGGPRLYLAESVAAVIEVKSNASAQLSEAQRTAALLAPLSRALFPVLTIGSGPSENIPLFVAGYTGWKTVDAVRRTLHANSDIAGILIIEEGIFVSSVEYGEMTATGPWALWGLISILHSITNGLQAATTDPMGYAS